MEEIDIHEIELNETIDGFHVTECLHESQVSKLYRVTHPDHQLTLIMKVPKISVILPSSVFAGFETEMRILSKLRGVYTPKIYGKGDLASAPYYVMEYVEGTQLQDATKTGPLPIEELCKIMIPVCKAIHELHRHNIIHLDLKPENIRNRTDGSVILLDFGTAHQAQLPDMYTVAHEQQPITVDYVAPEQLFGVRNDSRSDIYAIGAMLYELATGQPPFPKDNMLTVKKRLYIPPKPPRAINPDIPAWLQEIILKCLEIRPEDRFHTAKEIAYGLAHPNMVTLTELSEQTRRPGPLTLLTNWLGNREFNFVHDTETHPQQRLTNAPHILVAVKLIHSSEELKFSMRDTMLKIAKSDKHSYFTCLSILPKENFSDRGSVDEFVNLSHPKHIQAQAEMRHWLEPMRLAQSRVNIQVFYGDPSTEIVNYAKQFAVDHIIMCAHRSEGSKKTIGSVPEKVIAEAPCSVTVVRTRQDKLPQ
ncbi:MAG: bifunctional serine/threonine-protein kinase/universal stress protein [Gammaproteobacteria bacterium]|nr:bifunctional serine/threonine-protein kinase/universal stress protein [Gammaproteobacteria bacterium]